MGAECGLYVLQYAILQTPFVSAGVFEKQREVGGLEPLRETGYGRLHIIHTRRHSGVVGIPVVILKGKVCQNILADF